MSTTYNDEAVAAMRELVAVIDRDLANPASADATRAAWTKLVEVLALGPAPEHRTCPVCQRVGMRAASRCMYCWTSLAALPPVDAASATPAPADDAARSHATTA